MTRLIGCRKLNASTVTGVQTSWIVSESTIGSHTHLKPVIAVKKRMHGSATIKTGGALIVQRSFTRRSTMIVTDNRLNRELTETIAQTTTLTERDLRSFRGVPIDDADHEYYDGKIDEVVEKLRENETTRRAVMLADYPEMCMIGVHVLVRERIHVLSWLRASDIDEYRDEDLGFLYYVGRRIRKELGNNKRIMVHVFTSSLHSEVSNS
jgi:uncharacterized DUF497 family protein